MAGPDAASGRNSDSRSENSTFGFYFSYTLVLGGSCTTPCFCSFRSLKIITSNGVCHLECNSHLHETAPAWFHANCAYTGPRIQYITSGQGPEELGRTGALCGGDIGRSICVGHAVGTSLSKRWTMANYCV